MIGDSVLACYLHPAGEVQHSFIMSLNMLMAYDTSHKKRLASGPLAMRCSAGGLVTARNNAADYFLNESGAEWLWFVDSDMGFEPTVVEQLLGAAHRDTRPVVGALCFGLKYGDSDGMGGYQTELFPTMFAWVEGPDRTAGFRAFREYPEDALVKVDGTGTGCLLIHRSVLTQVEEDFGPFWFDLLHDSAGGQLGEDLSFCLRLRHAGIPVHVATFIKTSHAKTVWLSEEHFRTQEAGRA